MCLLHTHLTCLSTRLVSLEKYYLMIISLSKNSNQAFQDTSFLNQGIDKQLPF